MNIILQVKLYDDKYEKIIIDSISNAIKHILTDIDAEAKIIENGIVYIDNQCNEIMIK